MAQSLSQVLLHIVFSTKNRVDSIDASIMPDLHAYLAATCRELGSHAYRVGGTENHVHLACTLPRTMSISGLLEKLKANSSKWMKTRQKRPFAWQAGYGAFSLGYSQLDQVVGYIDRQEEHHRQATFKEEFEKLLKRYRIEYDERYVWD